MRQRSLGNFITQNSTDYIASLRQCNVHEGGPQLNVDITTHYSQKNKWDVPDILDSYYDVCECVNFPKYVHIMGNWTINNHGNSLLAYFEPNCATEFFKAMYIEAGGWSKSADMHTHTRKYGENMVKVHSFGPDPNSEYYSLSCSTSSHDKIMKLELFETLNKSEISVNVNKHTNVSTIREDDYNLINFFASDNFKGK